MTSYYLVVFEEDEWHVDRNILLAALHRDWPTAELKTQGDATTRSEVRDVHWRCTTENDVVDAYTHRDGTCLYLEGRLESIAKFVVWYRRLVPDHIDVVFCDNGYSFNGTIPAGAGEDAVIEIANRGDEPQA